MATIPTDLSCVSLIIASTVQVLGYQIRRQLKTLSAMEEAASVLARVAEMERFDAALEQTLIEIGYLDPQAPKHLMRRLRRLFGRAGPDTVELNILMGSLSAAGATAGRRRSLEDNDSA